jgi:hypothetical protein
MKALLPSPKKSKMLARSVLHVQSFTVQRTIAKSGTALRKHDGAAAFRGMMQKFCRKKFNLTLMLMGGCLKVSDMVECSGSNEGPSTVDV